MIEYNENIVQKKICAIYFSSNDIYYPNDENTFRKKIVEKNFYEWYNTRIENAQKHIFIRDIHKQWYLSGINAEVNTPEKLLNFLRTETAGYEIITIGSSAGGYAAVLYGQQLAAFKTLTFNGQFELNSLLQNSKYSINPLLFKYENSLLSCYYDLKLFLKRPDVVFYFYSNRSPWDIGQYQHISSVEGLNIISFNTSHHGIPFLKNCLPIIINDNTEQLKILTLKKQNSILFSIKIGGFYNSMQMLILQLKKKFIR